MLHKLSLIVEAERKAHLWGLRRHLATFELNRKAIVIIIGWWMHGTG
jgi:hypothetical protein